MSLYLIANWEAHFETYETKKLTYLKWVPTPNKHDGLGFRRLVAQTNNCELFAAWNLILQVASKGRRGDRGTLARNGKPLTAQDLSIMTGFPAPIFERALVFFSSEDMGWLTVGNQEHPEKTAEPPVKTAESRKETGSPAAEGKEGTEGREGMFAPEIPSIDEVIAYGQSLLANQIPEDYCRKYHNRKTENHGWIKNGRVVLWQSEMARYWEGDKHGWGRNGSGYPQRRKLKGPNI